MKRNLLFEHIANAGCVFTRHGKEHDIYKNPKRESCSLFPSIMIYRKFWLKKGNAGASHHKPENAHLFFTDCHDIEMTMLYFEEIRGNLFSEYGDWDKMDSAWESIIEKASLIGYVRWFNDKNDFRLFFDGFFNTCDNNNEKQILFDKLNDRSHKKKNR